jgi:transposase
LGYKWKRARQSLKPFRNQELFETGKQETESLLSLHKQGFIALYFADESHFGLTPNIPYAWQHKDSPILLPCRKSNRLTVFGLLSTESDFKHYTTPGSMNSQYLIACIDEFCQTITKKTVIVLDNAPTHRSKAFKNKIMEWQSKDLYIYFLPPYSPELNKIEILWRFIKYKWLPFDAFLNFNNLKDRLNEILESIGIKYVINFY